ncbi:MAG: DUF4383 domain-containing protein [Minisyncoccia bacterium]
MSGKMLALVLGVVFVLVGILGFISNPLVGEGALFHTNTAHNLVHLAFGLILLGVAMWAPMQSALWLKVLGALYLLVALLGFVMTSPLLGLVEVNGADNWLHVVLGVVLIGLGFWAHEEEESPAMPTMM